MTSVVTSPLELRLSLPLSGEDLQARVDAAIADAAAKVVAERLADDRIISLKEAAAMTPFTVAGFKRVATRENLPFIKGLHKTPPGYQLGDVRKMIDRLKVWPKGKPADQPAVVRFPQTPKASAA